MTSSARLFDPPHDRTRKSNVSAVAILGYLCLAVAVIVPWFGSTFYIRLGIEAMLLGCLALSVDILLGITGLLSLGHAAFFGIGAYSSTLVLLHGGPSLWLALGAGVGMSTLIALLFGAIAVRLHGVYFALVTFAFSEVLYKVAFHTRAIGGSDGLLGVHPPQLNLLGTSIDLANSTIFYYLVLLGVVALYFGTRRLLATPLGSVLAAIRDNEARVGPIGYRAFWYKWMAFVLSGAVAGVGGALYPILRGFVSPDLIGFDVSTNAVIMTLVGGMGTLIGPILGAIFLTFLQLIVGIVTERHLLIVGAILVAFVLFCPQGFVGAILQRVRKDK